MTIRNRVSKLENSMIKQNPPEIVVVVVRDLNHPELNTYYVKGMSAMTHEQYLLWELEDD